MKVYVQNKLFSVKGSSVVVDAANTELFQVEGKFFSLRNTKRICDQSGNVLYTVRNKLINVFTHKTNIYDQNMKKVATVRNKFFSLKQHYFVEGENESLEIEGEFLSLHCDIKRNGVVIGSIRREINFITDSFELEASESDMPFCIALVIAVDNICDAIRRSSD